MGMILTLIAGARGRSSLPHLAVEIAATLGIRSEPNWLARGEACDLILEAANQGSAEATARTLIKDVAIDVLVQPIRGRRKQLLVADLESTIIENEMLDELAEFLGLRDEVSEITRQAMNGEIDFAAALTARVALLAGMKAARLDEAATRIRIMPGAAALVATMRAHGAYAALVSGGFSVFTAPVREALGFDVAIANELIVENGRLTGRVRAPIVTRETKLATLKAHAAERGLPLAASLAVGDGANDLPMLKAAGLGVAFHAKPVVAAEVPARIDHGDLTALLYLQGYRQSDFVERPNP